MAIRRLTDGVDGHQMQTTDAKISNKQPSKIDKGVILQLEFSASS
jgi:hypothetical protein